MQVRVVVTVGAKKDSLMEVEPDLLEITVRAHARDNMANYRVRELVAGYYGAEKNAVRILKGHHFAKKLLRVSV
jgi:uncharacterized protein YggU (UPF0235/DUF167 family)